MKKPILHLETFLTSNNLSSYFMNSDEMSLLDNSFSLDEYKSIIKNDDLQIGEKRDAYKPKNTRGSGEKKEGYCEECKRWFKLKNSSYWYHMNYKHGINSKGIKYPEPEIRIFRGRLEGFCEGCDCWISLGHKYNNKSSKFGWYRHCQKIHKTL